MKIVNRTKAKNILSELSIEEDGDQIGWNMMIHGKPDFKEEYLASLKEVTPKDVERVIRKTRLNSR